MFRYIRIFFFNRVLETEQINQTLETFVDELFDNYDKFESNYFSDVESNIKSYDKFDVLSFWKKYTFKKENNNDLLQIIVSKYLSIDSTEIYCETSFKYAKLCKNDLRRKLSNSSLSNTMFLLNNKEFAVETIMKKFL